jgi:hypothetical protein
MLKQTRTPLRDEVAHLHAMQRRKQACEARDFSVRALLMT